jgi:hypothetical protein
MNEAHAIPHAETSEAAERGTAGHWIIEQWLDGGDPEVGEYTETGYQITQELLDAAERCFDWLTAQKFDRIQTEVRVPVGRGLVIHPEDLMWGTSDIIARKGSEMWVVDFKFGYVPVESEGNIQMLAYAAGADVTDIAKGATSIHAVIVQPAHWPPKPWEITVDDLTKLRKDVQAALPKMLGPDPEFNPGEDQCRYCAASGQCRAQAEWAISEDFEEITPDDLVLLSDEEMADYLNRANRIKGFLTNLHAAALARIAVGGTIPGYKVVESQTRMAWIDHDEALEMLLESGVGEPDDIAPRKLRTPKQIADMGINVDPLTHRPTGKPSLVLDKDKRPSITPDFEALDDGNPTD